MKRHVSPFAGWEPHELGSSLPVGGRLRRWLAALAAVWIAAAVLAAVVLVHLGRPGTDPAEPSYVRQVVLERLARTELPVWSPGGPLPAAEAPAFASPPPPPPALEPHPGDPPTLDPERLTDALAALDGGDALDAATELAEMADRQPRSWLLAYDSGLGYLAAGFHDRAARALGRAQARLDDSAAADRTRPQHLAAAIATRYAAGHAARRQDCVGAIRDLKLAVRDLGRFVDAGGARTFDRRLPYRVTPQRLSNLDVWSALVETYLGCEEGYPAEYFERYSDASSFRGSEYADPRAPDVREGPFPEALAACIASDGATARCWALSNLNALYLANRSLLERPDLPAAYEPHREALARLAYDTALLAATGPDAAQAPPILLHARRLRPEDPALRQKVDALARHLGGALQDFSVLAERFRGRSVDDLAITPETPDDELKGIAWALREAWQEHLAQGAPEAMFREAAEARRRLPAAYLDSLDAWEEEAQRTLRDALADEIRVQKRRGNRAMAAGLRDFRADWLGGEWPGRADAAWWTWELRAARWGLLAALAVLLAALVLLYRAVIHPYVVFTTDLYRPEIDRREHQRRERQLPVTGPEMYEMEQRRRGELP